MFIENACCIVLVYTQREKGLYMDIYAVGGGQVGSGAGQFNETNTKRGKLREEEEEEACCIQ